MYLFKYQKRHCNNFVATSTQYMSVPLFENKKKIELFTKHLHIADILIKSESCTVVLKYF